MQRVSKIISLSLPPRLKDEAERIAKDESRTKSELFREALRQYVSRRRWAKIRDWGREVAERLELKENDVDRLIRQVRPDSPEVKSRAGRRGR